MPDSKPSQRLHLPRQSELAQRRERNALVQHLIARCLDLAQQGAVDAGRNKRRTSSVGKLQPDW